MHSAAGGVAEPDAEKEALREEVGRLRGERARVKGLKAQLERSMAALGDQRTAFLEHQARTPSAPCFSVTICGGDCLPEPTAGRSFLWLATGQRVSFLRPTARPPSVAAVLST